MTWIAASVCFQTLPTLHTPIEVASDARAGVVPVEAAEAPGAAVGEPSFAAAVVGRVFVPFAEFLVGVSVPTAAASAAFSQHPAAAAPVSDVLDLVSVEVSGVPLAAVRRASAVVAGIAGPAFGFLYWEPLGAGAEEHRSDGLDSYLRRALGSLIEEADCSSLPPWQEPLRVR